MKFWILRTKYWVRENEFQQCHLHGLNYRVKRPVKILKIERIPEKPNASLYFYFRHLSIYVCQRKNIKRYLQTFWLNMEWFNDEKNRVIRTCRGWAILKRISRMAIAFYRDRKANSKGSRTLNDKCNCQFFSMTPESFVC